MYFPDRTGYTGTYDTSTDPDRITLDGSALWDFRDFAQAVTDGVLAADGKLMVSIINGTGFKTWLVEFKDAATDYLELIEEQASSGTFTHGDSVRVWAAVSGSYIENLESSLIKTSDTITVTSLTGVLGYSHDVTVSGLTADRSFVIPAGADKDELEITLMTDSPDAYELVIIPDSGVSVSFGGVLYTAAEVTRLCVRGERLRFKVHADGVWYVEDDGRLPQSGLMHMSAALTTNTAGAWTNPGFGTTVREIGLVCTTGSASNMVVRRGGLYRVSLQCAPQIAIGDEDYYAVKVDNLASTGYLCSNYARCSAPTTSTLVTPIATKVVELSAGDNVAPYFRSTASNRGVDDFSGWTFFSVDEKLP